jgi:hypothetical protein
MFSSQIPAFDAGARQVGLYDNFAWDAFLLQVLMALVGFLDAALVI